MLKYYLLKDTIEINSKDRRTIRQVIITDSLNQEPETIAIFSTENDALAALSKQKSSLESFGDTIRVTEFYVQPVELDDDEDDFGEYKDILSFSKMEIEVYDIESYDTIGIYDNYADAEQSYNEYEGNAKIKIWII